MNIAIFTNNYLPNPYGVSTSVEGFRRSITALGHTVYIFAPSWGDNSFDEKNIFRYPSIKVPTKIDFLLVVPYSHKIDDIIEELDIDIIHAQHPNLLGTVANKWSIKKNVPIIFTWHSLYDRYTHYVPIVPDKLSGHWAMKEAAGFADDCDHIIVPTQSVIKIIKKAGVKHERISVVASGVDEKLFEKPDGCKIKQKYNISEQKQVLVTISRLTEEKNIIFLANCVSEVLKNEGEVIFLCGGEGDLQDEMKEMFEKKGVLEQVVFVGKIARGDVKDYLAAGDIFVYASTSETQGTIVTENMYVGKPIVAVDENGVGSLIENEVTGLLVEENEKKFTETLEKLVRDKSKIKELGRNAYKIARKKYTIDVCAKEMLKVYESVLSKFK